LEWWHRAGSEEGAQAAWHQVRAVPTEWTDEMNKNTANDFEELGDNIVILDSDGMLLYGHQLSEYVIATGKTIPSVAIVSGVNASSYISYLAYTFPDNRAVQALVKALSDEMVSEKLFREVSDSITLKQEDVRKMGEVQRHLIAKGLLDEQ
jgi:hypothetical protein